MEGCATILSAPPKMATSCVVPPLHVMAMRSTFSGMANSLPFASTTTLEPGCCACPSAGFCPCPSSASPPCWEQPPKATVPVVATPAAISSSTKCRRLMILVFCSIGSKSFRSYPWLRAQTHVAAYLKNAR